MKQQPEDQQHNMARSRELVPRTFYRPDSSCSEYGSWYFSTAELGEVGPFDSREEAKEALEMSLHLDCGSGNGQLKKPAQKAALKKQVH
jgi:hypothetical protein